MPTVAVTNQKGGVGKTTIAFNLAKGLAQRGYSVLAVDNDPQGNLTSALHPDPTALEANVLSIYRDGAMDAKPETVAENVGLIGATIHLAKTSDGDIDIIYKLKEGLEPFEEQYDFILVDCLPSFGFLNMAALRAADHVLIPTKPAPFALAGLKDLFDTLDKARTRLNENLEIAGIVLNLVEGRATNIATELEEVLRENYGDLVFETRIHKGTKLEESPSFNQSIMEYDGRSKQAQQLNSFIDEFLQRVKSAG